MSVLEGWMERLGLKPSRKLVAVVLTGAGVSAESGVPIFRGPGSLWELPEARKLAARARPPWNNRGTWEFYEWRRQLVSRCKPNPAHLVIAEMERYFEDFTLITQNVDGLHQRAGSRRVFELHGSMWKGRCPKCEEIVDLPETPLPELPPKHSCGTPMRPHVVQFGEPVDRLALTEGIKASSKADLFFVVGTSAVVHPAAGLPFLALESGAKVIEINPTETPLTPYVTLSLRGKAGEILPKLWREFLSKEA
ncbi:MAG: NAD-dependent deacylase [Candidatus Hadarchaeales archaeon]